MLRWLHLPLLVATGHALAQCGPCVIIDTCTVDPPFPAVCPSITPVGTVGVPFELDVTFWVPPSFPEPSTQLNVVVQELVVTGIQDIPLGLTYQANSPTLTYYPQQNGFGCVRVCGTPMLPGADTIRVRATVTGTVGGINTTQAYEVPIPIQVLPDSADTLPGFTPAPAQACVPATVSFSPASEVPGMEGEFNWSFGNGASHIGPVPPDQTYTAADAYAVVLEQAFSVPMLTQVQITGIPNAWCGDLDEPSLPFVGCVGQPDLYFTLHDSRLGEERSTVISNSQAGTWSGLSMALGFPPFTLRLYDQDELSADDLLGTFTFDEAPGTFALSQGGASGLRSVQVQTVLTLVHQDTVVVHPDPDVTLFYDEDAGTVCAQDSGLTQYAWMLDGELLEGENGPCVQAVNGSWTVMGTSAAGCTSGASLLVNGVGISEGAALPFVSLGPVPCVDRLEVRIGHRAYGKPLQIRVRDALGRPVIASMAGTAGSTIPIDMSGTAAGLYLITLTDGVRTLSRPFTVVRP
jgi:hypothetical protein